MKRISPNNLTLPEPREGITGQDRTSDRLLSLRLEDQPVRDAILTLGHVLYTSGLTSRGVTLFERMQAPNPGDFVYELGSSYAKDRDTRLKGSGYLISSRLEWATSHAQWEEYKTLHDVDDEARGTDRAWYIQYGPQDDDVCRWVDSRFLAIPTELKDKDWGIRA